MAGNIDFYFDFSSPYGYFAATRIDELAQRYDRSVNWHPVLLGVLFKSTGMAPLPLIPVKGEYSMHDMERTARLHQIPYARPSVLPIPTQAAARAMLWIRAEFGDARAIDFAKAVYRAYFVDGVNVGEPAAVMRIAGGLGIDAGAVNEGMNSASIKDRLRAEVEQAQARGVFGAPFMIVDGESFWGFDRFDQMEMFLKNGKI